jgi:hypothetical protein
MQRVLHVAMISFLIKKRQEFSDAQKAKRVAKKLANTRHRLSSTTPLEAINGKLPKLLTGDIILIRKKKGGIGRTIFRKITNSYWDHIAMVIFAKNIERGYSTNVIIESIQGSSNRPFYFGAEIHALDKYLNDPKEFDIGIKRVTWLTRPLRHRIRSYALMNIDTPYYPLKTWRLIRAYIFFMAKKKVLSRQRYSCSALVQKAYYEAVDPNDRTKVLFGNRAFTPMQLLDITSPADFAKSPLSEWIYNRR